jgi:hypothetical protein
MVFIPITGKKMLTYDGEGLAGLVKLLYGCSGSASSRKFRGAIF